MVYVYDKLNKGFPDGAFVLDCTSTSKTWGRLLSPFNIGSVTTINGHCKVFENFWQYSKVYEEFLDADGNIVPEYWEFREYGFNLDKATRYPLGKHHSPAKFHLYGEERLGLREARVRLYVYWYSMIVKDLRAYQALREMYQKYGDLVLIDYDGRDTISSRLSYDEVLSSPKAMAHGYVLSMMLTNNM